MLDLATLGQQIEKRRKMLGLTQAELARNAGVSRATLEALENGRTGEVGFSRLSKLLSVLGLGLQLREASALRPTLDQLLEERNDVDGLDGRR